MNRINYRILLYAGAMLLLLSLCKLVFAGEVQLPIDGYHLKFDLDEQGRAYFIYFPVTDKRQIRLYDLQTGQDEQVPGSTNRFLYSWDIIYAGIGVGYGYVGVSWCVDNCQIWYAEKSLATGVWTTYCLPTGTTYDPATGQWTTYGAIYTDHVGDCDTNRTDIGIGPQGVMVLAQADGRIMAMYKPHGGSFHYSEVSPFQTSEPSHPRCEWAQGTFWAAFDVTTNQGRSLRISRRENGIWQEKHTFLVQGGCPDAVGFYVTPIGDYYVSALTWVQQSSGGWYTKVFYGHYIYSHYGPGEYYETYIYIGNIAADDTHPPAAVVAVDTEGNVAVGWGFDWNGNCGSRMAYKRAVGSWKYQITETIDNSIHIAPNWWEITETIGDSNHIALDCYDDTFHMITREGGHLQYATFSFVPQDPTPTPTVKPTVTYTPTLGPTSVHTPTVTITPVPTGTPLPVPTQCLINYQDHGFCCTGSDLAMLCLTLVVMGGLSRIRKRG